MKFGEVMLYIVIIIIASIVVTMSINPVIFNNFKSKVVSLFKAPITEQDDVLTRECVDSFIECKSVYEKKYEITVAITELKKADNLLDATTFFNTWKGQTQISLDAEYTNSTNQKLTPFSLPLVLFAINFRGLDGVKPHVIVCDKNGELIKTSKVSLSCG